MAVLEKHWPDVERYGDIRELEAEKLERPDLVCGGFPCQDISIIGEGAGIAEGERSSLWFEMLRVIGVLRPRYVLVENVLGDLIPYSEALPHAGTVRNGILYPRAPSGRGTDVIGSSSWDTWPTPRARDWKGGQKRETLKKKGRSSRDSLPDCVRWHEGIGVRGGSGGLNPEWVEWLMGFPRGWTDLED